MSEEVASIFWTIAELAKDNSLQTEAQTLWRTIKNRAPASSPKVAFAKNRLEKRQTQFERLWE
jgi:hypothetical protein